MDLAVTIQRHLAEWLQYALPLALGASTRHIDYNLVSALLTIELARINLQTEVHEILQLPDSSVVCTVFPTANK
ncbi:hypothetical protein RJ641_009002 [Dillenia turbinata]|uniref:Uncharacterized protein n=1 Tax=Dillenia turbinata TaxID=194707 RepID=A0AAN8Z4P2_9MAGN